MVIPATDFSTNVRAIVGPSLSRLGFSRHAVDEEFNEGGRIGFVVYFSSQECKVQIYWSPRGGEINCMIAPITAPNVLGLHDDGKGWRFWNEFVERPDLPVEELVESQRFDKAHFETDEKWLRWWAHRIEMSWDAARAGILGRQR